MILLVLVARLSQTFIYFRVTEAISIWHSTCYAWTFFKFHAVFYRAFSSSCKHDIVSTWSSEHTWRSTVEVKCSSYPGSGKIWWAETLHSHRVNSAAESWPSNVLRLRKRHSLRGRGNVVICGVQIVVILQRHWMDRISINRDMNNSFLARLRHNRYGLVD